MPLKEDFYYLHFLRGGSMPQPAGHVGKYQTWSGGRSRNEGKHGLETSLYFSQERQSRTGETAED